ncbi:MAG: SufD family Fe-S cluster assembly protein [Candidatus Gracilibacteria bacterium]|jgi:Fe-S cluster assembly protein SufD|nr:SufD family Fe-S cluster assembly protein [Candidatus Gracilibacteria bacterium]
MKKNYLYITNPNDLNFSFLENESQNLIVLLTDKAEENLKYSFNFPNKNAESEILFLIIRKNPIPLNIKIDINHKINNCKSDLKFKTILFKEAKVIFTGNIKVEENLKEISSSMVHKNLLLSEMAKVISKPNLEINSNGVEINHGFATGAFPKELLYYLESRGLSEKKAKKALIKAFIFNEINAIKDKPLRKQIKKETLCLIP